MCLFKPWRGRGRRQRDKNHSVFLPKGYDSDKWSKIRKVQRRLLRSQVWDLHRVRDGCSWKVRGRNVVDITFQKFPWSFTAESLSLSHFSCTDTEEELQKQKEERKRPLCSTPAHVDAIKPIGIITLPFRVLTAKRRKTWLSIKAADCSPFWAWFQTHRNAINPWFTASYLMWFQSWRACNVKIQSNLESRGRKRAHLTSQLIRFPPFPVSAFAKLHKRMENPKK